MTRHLHDLDWLTSIAPPLSAIAAAATGIVADLWDLNDFWYHTVSGHMMAALGALHVVLNRHKLTGYARPLAVAARAGWPGAVATRPPAGPPAREAGETPAGSWLVARSCRDAACSAWASVPSPGGCSVAAGSRRRSSTAPTSGSSTTSGPSLASSTRSGR